MKYSRIIVLIALIAIVSAIAVIFFYKPLQSELSYIEIVDMANRTIKVPPPNEINRIVVLWPEATRVILALQLQDKIVGVSNLDGRDPITTRIFPKLKELPAVGKPNNPNIEEILKLKPDIIFSDALRPEAADDIQLKTGIPVVCVRIKLPGTTKMSLNIITFIGEILGVEDKARKVKSLLENSLSRVTSITSNIPEEDKVKIYLAWSGEPLSTTGGADPFELAGVINVAYNPKYGWYKYKVNFEQILLWDPDIILVKWLPYDPRPTINEILNDPQWQQLRAVREKHVYPGFDGYAGWYPETVVICTMRIAKIAYPELFKDLDVIAEGNRIYKEIYGIENFFSMLVQEYGLDIGLTKQTG